MSVFNLSDIPLSESAQLILGLGLNFIPNQTLSCSKIKTSLSSSIIMLKRRMCYRLTFGHANFNPVIPPIDNRVSSDDFYADKDWYRNHLSPFICNALNSVESYHFRPARLSVVDTIIQQSVRDLYNNDDIVIKPADKNLGTCILSTTLYTELCLKHLNDSATYERLPSFSTSRSYAILRLILSNNSLLFESDPYDKNYKQLSTLAKSLLQLEKTAKPCSFYVLPKVHKGLDNLSGRPIASSLHTLTYHASKYLHNCFLPIVKMLPGICHSSSSFILDLQTPPPLSDSSCILCADVKSLYPSIPTDYGLMAVQHTLRYFEGHPSFQLLGSSNFLLQLLKWVLSNNFIEFNSNIYRQCKGTAMGTPVAVCYANMVLFYMEQHCINTSTCLFYRRYIDDVFAIFTSETAARDFVRKFQLMNSDIQFEAITYGRSGVFLDAEISISATNTISTKVYQKAMNKYLYLPPFSAHDRSCMAGVIKQELVRYRLLCCSDADFHNVVDSFMQRLLRRGYTATYLQSVFNPLPQRIDALMKLRDRFKPNPHYLLPSATTVQRGPIITLHIPRLLPPDMNYLKLILAIPDSFANLPEFKYIYQLKRVILGKKNFKSIGRSLIYKKI